MPNRSRSGVAVAAGAVVVQPVGETSAPLLKR